MTYTVERANNLFQTERENRNQQKLTGIRLLTWIRALQLGRRFPDLYRLTFAAASSGDETIDVSNAEVSTDNGLTWSAIASNIRIRKDNFGAVVGATSNDHALVVPRSDIEITPGVTTTPETVACGILYNDISIGGTALFYDLEPLLSVESGIIAIEGGSTSGHERAAGGFGTNAIISKSANFNASGNALIGDPGLAEMTQFELDLDKIYFVRQNYIYTTLDPETGERLFGMFFDTRQGEFLLQAVTPQEQQTESYSGYSAQLIHAARPSKFIPPGMSRANLGPVAVSYTDANQ